MAEVVVLDEADVRNESEIERDRKAIICKDIMKMTGGWFPIE